MSDVQSTLAERGSRYGTFAGHANVTQIMYGTATDHATKNGISLNDVHKEALHMIFHKIGRIVNGDPNYADSWHDIAGYATLVEKHLNGENI